MDARGFGVIKTNTDETQWQVKEFSLTLGPPNDYFDLNNAQGITITNDQQFAFVSGFNTLISGVPSHDPNVDPFRPSGSNTGVIRDPFGDARLVAATRPTPLGFADNVVLSPDGRHLLAGYQRMDAVVAEGSFSFIDGATGDTESAVLRITLTDFETDEAGNRTAPGYHHFSLIGLSVGKDGENRALDVYRVQQRLKYLGFHGFNAQVLQDAASALRVLEVNGDATLQQSPFEQVYQPVLHDSDATNDAGATLATISTF